MDVFRILKEPYLSDPLSVIGAEKAPGRWNPRGFGVLYTSSSPALALLEIMVHFPVVRYEDLPSLRIFTLRVPDETVRWADPDLLPESWDRPEQLPITQTFFEEWLIAPADLVLAVPSAVLDISWNYLIHPKHHLYEQVQILNQKDIEFERRLWKF